MLGNFIDFEDACVYGLWFLVGIVLSYTFLLFADKSSEWSRGRDQDHPKVYTRLNGPLALIPGGSLSLTRGCHVGAYAMHINIKPTRPIKRTITAAGPSGTNGVLPRLLPCAPDAAFFKSAPSGPTPATSCATVLSKRMTTRSSINSERYQ
jgi:hypothetical protein